MIDKNIIRISGKTDVKNLNVAFVQFENLSPKPPVSDMKVHFKIFFSERLSFVMLSCDKIYFATMSIFE